MITKFAAVATVASIAFGFIGPAGALPKNTTEPPGDPAVAWNFATPEAARCPQNDPPVAVRLDAQLYYTGDMPEYATYRRYACISIAKQRGLKPGLVASKSFRPVVLTLRIDAVGAPPFVPLTIPLTMSATGKPPFVPVVIQLDVHAYGTH